MTDQRWDRVAAFVKARRVLLDRDVAEITSAADFSPGTWDNLAGGHGVGDRSLTKADRALGLAPGTLAAIRDGTPVEDLDIPDPAPFSPSADDRAFLLASVDRLRDGLTELRRAIEGTR